MRTEVVEYSGFDYTARLTVSEANNRIQILKEVLEDEGRRAIETDEKRRFMRIISYPACYAAVIHTEGLPFPWPPADFETFYEEIPGALTIELEKAIFRLNRNWRPEVVSSEDPKSPAPASTSGSPNG